MQKAQDLPQHEHEVALAHGAVGRIGIGPQARLRELDVPVAELVPHEAVQLAGDLAELEVVVGRVHRSDDLGQPREDPAVGRRGGLGRAGLVSVKVHEHEAARVLHLVREVAGALQLRLVELQVLGAGHLHEQAEAHAVGAVVLHEAQRVHAVAAALRHGLAVGGHDRRVDDDVVEGNGLVAAVHGGHDHARHPQPHDVAGRGEHLRRVGVAHLRGVHALLRPAHGGKRPQLAGEPGVQHVLVLAHRRAADRAHLDFLHRGVLPAAGIAVEHGDAVAPPQLAGDAPVLQVREPVQVHLLPASRMELDGAVLHHAGRRLLQGVHGHKPLLGLPGLQLGMATVAGHDGMVVILHVIEQAQLVEGGHDGLAGLVAVHAGELPVAFHDMGRLVEDVDALKPGALPHRPVIGIVRGGHLHAARAELGIHVPVGEDGDLAVHERQLHRLADEMSEALVLGVHGHAGVAEHRLGARGGDDQVLQATRRLGKRVAQVPQMPRLVHVLGLIVGDGRGAVRAPVHDALAAVDDALVVPVGEQLPHGAHVGRLQREVLVGVVAGAAHALDLVHDGSAVLVAPLVAFLDEGLAADFQTRDALLGQALVHLGLGGDAGMVGADDPAGLETAHAGAADASVLDGVVQRVPHVQHAGDVRRRDDDGVGLPPVLAEARRALEVAGVLPRLEDGPLHGGVVGGLPLVLGHRPLPSLSLDTRYKTRRAAHTRPPARLPWAIIAQKARCPRQKGPPEQWRRRPRRSPAASRQRCRSRAP